MPASGIRLRDVDEADARLIGTWANDPAVREQSFNPEQIAWDVHWQWFTSRLANPGNVWFMATRPNGTPLAQVRFTCDADGTAELHYSVAPEWRGQGIGLVAVRAAVRSLFQRGRASIVVAHVKPQNAASLSAFRRAGFREDGIVTVHGHQAVRFSIRQEDRGVGGVVAVIQARVGSSRLPRKVLADIHGCTMLERVVTRAASAAAIDEVVVATSVLAADDAVADEANRLGVRVVRGSEQDVLSRYLQSAQETDARIVVRITADCPLIDPAIVSAVVTRLVEPPSADYASNVIHRTFPRGLDVEAFTAEALARVERLAKAPREREHVTLFFYEHPELFSLRPIDAESDFSHARWTVDEPADLEFIRAVTSRVPHDAGWREVLSLVEADPALADINRAVAQKPLQP